MFKKFFKKIEDEEEHTFQSVDPVLEQRRKEKFSSPLIYNDEDDVVIKEEVKEVKKEVVKKTQNVDTSYRMTEIISPMAGVQKSTEVPVKPKVQKKLKFKSTNDELVPIISPFYGPAVEQDEDDCCGVVEEPSVENNLRNIANIVKEEQDQLKIIEERTGEFKLDFQNDQDSLIDEIDDSMSLDELMSLYEKKFKD